jgi:cobalt-precorrin-5B (C1)-methyltransferase
MSLEQKQMITDETIQLQTGFTTGTCAAAAAYAACCFLEDIPIVSPVLIDLPDGGTISIPIEFARGKDNFAEAGVRKDSGDDPDVTNGMIVIAKISRSLNGDINFFAGEGVGIVTKNGLSVPPGEPAINPVPRQMIRNAIRKICSTPIDVTISIPGGQKIAERTFNPRLGITGGLSILGTTGIVRPFSRKAIQDTIRCTFSIAKAASLSELFLVPGNIGRRAANRIFTPPADAVIEVSNEWGFSIDAAVLLGFHNLTLVGHPGKLAKLAEEKWDTHSSNSSSAFEYVNKICNNLIDDFPYSETSTVEGLFQMLSQEFQTKVSALIGNTVCEKVIKRTGIHLPIKVVLTDMNGNEYGRSNCCEHQ